MTRFIARLFLFTCLVSYGLTSFAGEPESSQMTDLDSLNQKIEAADSQLKALEQSIQEENDKLMDEINEESMKQSQRNLEQFMARRDAEQKKKRSIRLWIKGGGLAIALIIFIVGRIRRKENS